jgi:hypothetical protein
MAIDIRAAVSCSLGTLISGSISDGYVQGQGLILTSGSVVISGLITPAIGAAVTVSYVKAGVTRTIPRRLRVLSSFADPFRRTTSVELGCKLTYLQDKREAIDWTAYSDPANTLTTTDARIITIPIRAQAVADKCLAELGITGSFTLTNTFSIERFDFGAGYVQVLGNLLVSESKCGYLDSSDVLQVFSLDQAGGTGPVIDTTQLIDLSKIGAGQVPGEAVTVSYSTLRIKRDVGSGADAVKKRNWERDEQISSSKTVFVSNPFYKSNPYPYSVPEFFEYGYIPVAETINTYDSWDRVIKRITTTKSILAEVAPSYVTSRAGTGGRPGEGNPSVGYIPCETRTETVYQYEVAATSSAANKPENYANVTKETTTEFEPYIKLAASTVVYQLAGDNNINFTWRLSPVELFMAQRTTITRDIAYDPEGAQITKANTQREVAYGYTQRGTQYLGKAFQDTVLFEPTGPGGPLASNGVGEAILERAARLVDDGTTQSIAVGRELDLQRRPSSADRVNSDTAEQVGSTSQLSLAMGSDTAQRRTEFSLPYAPDDRFFKAGGSYGSTPSDAPQKAQQYGLVQNRLLLGNRSGMNIQAAPEVLPTAPFAAFVVRSGGVSGLYRTNGTSWTFDAKGIVVSTDALFWGGVGGTGDLFFPVAPGISSLPAAPATTTVNILDGNGNVVGSYQQMVVSAVVPVWQETRALAGALTVSAVVTGFDYPLQVLASVVARIKTTAAVTLRNPALLALPLKARASIAVVGELFLIDGDAAPVLGMGQVTPTSTATSAGWTLAYDSTDDEGQIQLSGFPFTFTLDSVGYTSCWITSNAYLTFSSASVVYNSLGASNPAVPKLHFGAGDWSYQRVYTKVDAGVAAIRWEGNTSYNAGAGNSNRFAEIRIYKATKNGTQYVEVKLGYLGSTSARPFMVATASTALAEITGTLTEGGSYVFEGNSTGTTWTAYSGKHISA